MNKYLWINFAYLIFYLCVFAVLINSVRSKGMSPNVGGVFFVMMLVFAGIIFLHLVSIGIIYFTKNLTLTYFITGLSSIVTISIVALCGRKIIENRNNAVLQKKWEEEAEETRIKAGLPEGIRHRAFRDAIVANDSGKVGRMAMQGERATDDDLAFAINACFDSGEEISTDIFETLIHNGADAKTASPVFIFNRFCKDIETVKLLLDAGANPQPTKDYFPLICLPKLKLLLQYGTEINLLTQTYYQPHKEDKEYFQLGRWTPLMVYLNEYPAYFEETKFLLSQKPDLTYKDENGYGLKDLLENTIRHRTSLGESVKELVEFRKGIE
jgi:hypothetical protein